MHGVQTRMAGQCPAISIPSSEALLSSFLGRERGHRRTLGTRADNLHLLPVVSKLLAAIQAHNVGASRESRRTTPPLLHRDRKAVTPMPAAKQRTQNPGEHLSTSQNRAPLTAAYMKFGIIYLDSVFDERVRQTERSVRRKVQLRALKDVSAWCLQGRLSCATGISGQWPIG